MFMGLKLCFTSPTCSLYNLTQLCYYASIYCFKLLQRQLINKMETNFVLTTHDAFPYNQSWFIMLTIFESLVLFCILFIYLRRFSVQHYSRFGTKCHAATQASYCSVTLHNHLLKHSCFRLLFYSNEPFNIQISDVQNICNFKFFLIYRMTHYTEYNLV